MEDGLATDSSVRLGDGHEKAAPFLAFARSVQPQNHLRARISGAHRQSEEECMPLLVEVAHLSSDDAKKARRLATMLVTAIRAKDRPGGVDGLVREYALSSQEGVALMCLAEALLRIPDTATRDRLIQDKIVRGDWQSHLGNSPSLFVNAATWGLLITGKLKSTASASGLGSALARLIARGGEPLIRQGVNLAMKMMGEQFVTGETIRSALTNSRKMEAKGFRYSYDMLGEAAMTAADAERYYADYEGAIHAIGAASAGRGVYEGPGLSIKLSALHPRYRRAQRDRVMTELYGRLKSLTLLARRYNIGINIDAEESERLDISLDLLEALCLDPDLAGWNGIGFVVQAYQKRAFTVMDFMIDLARRSRRRIMVRLVKGAYWDSEIKRAQIDGLDGFPVFTRKRHTDVSYMACARKLLAAPDAVFPQFATHNAQTLATIHTVAGSDFHAGQYEFQCLHGMGEPLYEEVVGPHRLDRPCRIYAPVGTHETLLAYLVRRLLENGANSSFINRIADAAVSIEDLVADPVELVRAAEPLGSPNPLIALPRELPKDRKNSSGIDIENEQVLASLSASLLASAAQSWTAFPTAETGADVESRPVCNPADRRDVVGHVTFASPNAIEAALSAVSAAGPAWAAVIPVKRAAVLDAAADRLEERMPLLLGLIIREAGKSVSNAIAEVREAVDFLRYYAAEIRAKFSNDTHMPVGPVLCISPWNFPLAIFTGQVAAALAAGNTVLAKPAEETPLIAAEAVRVLHDSGVPTGALHLLPGDGNVGGALVADERVRAVMFTGSTDVARLIQKTLAKRLNPDGRPVPLIAETGGQNALIVDSSALTEQVVADVLTAAFDSAGQRCSALRVLCIQEDVADRTIAMLSGALAQLRVGNPETLATDIGPVITDEARDGIVAHVERMRAAGHTCYELPLPESCAHGTFVPPTIIEIGHLSDLAHEVFGPVLHVIRYHRDQFGALIEQINETGYALTFGIHTRIDETIAAATSAIEAGNVYVNRNLVGAVVGVQPFGGSGLSGTGPKAGGPLYLRRLLAECPADPAILRERDMARTPGHVAEWARFLSQQGLHAASLRAENYGRRSPLGHEIILPGPVGERNVYSFRSRGRIFCACSSDEALCDAVSAVLATGNTAMLPGGTSLPAWLGKLPNSLLDSVTMEGPEGLADISLVLWDGAASDLLGLQRRCADRPGPLLQIHARRRDPVANVVVFPVESLLRERSTSTNTAAAGGNASLMAIS